MIGCARTTRRGFVVTRMIVPALLLAAATPAVAQDKKADPKVVAALKDRIAAARAELAALEFELKKLDPAADKPKEKAADPAAELVKAFRAKLEEEIKKLEDRRKLFATIEAASRAELDAALEGKAVAERERDKAREQLKAALAELAKLKPAPAEKK